MKTKLTPEQQKRADTLARMTPTEWDAVCKQCGICCMTKMEIPGILLDDNAGPIYLKQCCENFDTKTCKCSIYQTRFSKNPFCEKVDMDIILEGKLLPASCGYVEYIFGPAQHPAKVDFSQVCPVPYDIKLTTEQIIKDAIPESVLWNKYGR